jgi:hypothetical protein
MHNSEAKATVFGGFQLLDPRIVLSSRYLFLNNSTIVWAIASPTSIYA